MTKRVMALLLAAVLLPLGVGTTAQAEPACYKAQPPPVGAVNTAPSANPLDDARWAAGHPRQEALWLAYCDGDAARKAQLGKIALRPRNHWFTPDYPVVSQAGYPYSGKAGIRFKAREYVVESQGGITDKSTYRRCTTRADLTCELPTVLRAGNSNVIVPLTVFRLWPRGEPDPGNEDGGWPLTDAEQNAYKAWINELAIGLGNARVTIILEPDLGIVMRELKTVDNKMDRLAMARYAAERLSRNRNAHVYIDASSVDWLRVDEAVTMLRYAGIAHVRGFALGATHYSPLRRTHATDPERQGEVRYAAKLVQRLNATGVAALQHKRAVIDTSDNAKGFTFQQYYAEHPRSEGNRLDNAQICRSRTDTTCVTLGIPPTWAVWAQRWVDTGQLDATEAKLARTYVDGFLWFSRSWLVNQTSPFSLTRALGMAATSSLN